ncbi:hypothetical protein BDZ91DRAFT_749798 [Kalaharituber pfeilii]|nr:hypothetical protein BDZ91DRAFT_749798 [Kalaharituber pfeilii]
MLSLLRVICTVAAIGVLSLAGLGWSLPLVPLWDLKLYEHVGYEGFAYTRFGLGVTLLSCCEDLPSKYADKTSSMRWAITGLENCTLTLYPESGCKQSEFAKSFTDSAEVPNFLDLPYGATDTFNDKVKSFSVLCPITVCNTSLPDPNLP